MAARGVIVIDDDDAVRRAKEPDQPILTPPGMYIGIRRCCTIELI